MVAHELGSPISAINAWVEVLAQKALKPEEELHAFASIRSEIQRLNGLAADTRAIATIERDEFVVRPRRVPIISIVAAGVDLNRSLPGRHPLLTTILAYDDVCADPERIGQVLRNLLSNAAKYSPEGSPIELRTVRHGTRVRIEVIDRGPGIPPGDEERIFEKYERGRTTAGIDCRLPGVGLGLYLSRRIVQAHGGAIHVTATAGGGATFAFDLPIPE
jgi:two-component system sensor histidine kinase KdpD